MQNYGNRSDSPLDLGSMWS